MKQMFLQGWRLKMGKSTKEIAQGVGLSLSGYINIESGRRGPSRRTAEKIAEYLAVRQEQIVWPSDVSDCDNFDNAC